MRFKVLQGTFLACRSTDIASSANLLTGNVCISQDPSHSRPSAKAHFRDAPPTSRAVAVSHVHVKSIGSNKKSAVKKKRRSNAPMCNTRTRRSDSWEHSHSDEQELLELCMCDKRKSLTPWVERESIESIARESIARVSRERVSRE